MYQVIAINVRKKPDPDRREPGGLEPRREHVLRRSGVMLLETRQNDYLADKSKPCIPGRACCWSSTRVGEKAYLD